jgi:hypothetical protein
MTVARAFQLPSNSLLGVFQLPSILYATVDFWPPKLQENRFQLPSNYLPTMFPLSPHTPRRVGRGFQAPSTLLTDRKILSSEQVARLFGDQGVPLTAHEQMLWGMLG